MLWEVEDRKLFAQMGWTAARVDLDVGIARYVKMLYSRISCFRNKLHRGTGPNGPGMGRGLLEVVLSSTQTGHNLVPLATVFG